HGPYAGGQALPGMPYHRDLWKKLYNDKLAYEQDWQYPTAVSYTVKGANGQTTKTFADPERSPGVARHGGAANAPLGSFVKVDAGDANNPLPYARVLDQGNMGDIEMEGNITTMRNLGMTDPDPA